MQTETAIYAKNQPQSDFSIVTPAKDKTGSAYIFSVVDLLPQSVKDNNPNWKRGGLIRDAMTLIWNHGYIPLCEITPLKQQPWGTAGSNINPSERKHLDTTYVVNERNADGVIEPKQRGMRRMPDGSMAHDGLLRTMFYPTEDVAWLTQQQDGIVLMPVANEAEKNKAQLFLFPEWEQIKLGLAPWPDTIHELKTYFGKRLKATYIKGENSNTPDPAMEFERKTVLAAIQCCDTSISFGMGHLREAKTNFDAMKTMGKPWAYGQDAQMWAVQLGEQLNDTTVQSNKGIEALAQSNSEMASAVMEQSKATVKALEMIAQNQRQTPAIAAPGAEGVPSIPTPLLVEDNKPKDKKTDK